MTPSTSSSVTPSPPAPQSFLALGSFPVSRLFALGGQSIAASVSASALPMEIQGWFPVGLTGLISLLSKQLSRVFSSTAIRKHQFFGSQPSYWSNCHIHKRLLEKPWLWPYRCLSTKPCCFLVTQSCLTLCSPKDCCTKSRPPKISLLICTWAIWGQYPVFSHSEFLRAHYRECLHSDGY